MNPRPFQLNKAKRVVILEGFSTSFLPRIMDEYEFQKNIERLLKDGDISKIENTEFEKYLWTKVSQMHDKCNSIVIQDDLNQFHYYTF